MKKHITLLTGALIASSMTSPGAVLVAGWEDFTGSTEFASSQNDGETTISVAATTGQATKPWGQWNNSFQGPSTDGTFGSLSSTVATANTTNVAGSNLSLGRVDGTLVFTLTNNSGQSKILDGFYFDSVRKFGNSAPNWTLAFSGAISGTDASGTIDQVNGGMTVATSAQRDKFVDLSTLTDNVWEDGQDAIFTLSFTGSANDTNTSGGNELLLDNIAITAVPEPSSALLLSLAGFGLILRRRK